MVAARMFIIGVALSPCVRTNVTGRLGSLRASSGPHSSLSTGLVSVLDEIGVLDRALTSGSTHKPTPDGLHRKLIPFVFGSEYAPLFIATNRRAAPALVAAACEGLGSLTIARRPSALQAGWREPPCVSAERSAPRA
jgi:hypothetical protein